MNRLLFCYVNSCRFDRTEHYVQCEWAATYAYLADHLPGVELMALEYGLLGGSDRTLVRAMTSFRPDFVVFWSAVHEAPSVKRAAEMVRELAGNAKVIVWGDGPLWMPHYFARDPFDVIVVGGDPERVIADAVEAMAGGRDPGHGVLLRAESAWRATTPGALVSPDAWSVPDPTLIDVASYDRARDHRGKPGRDLSVTVARGCRIQCAGCIDPIKSGVRDRRMPVERVIAFMKTHAGDVTFQLHGPWFGFDRAWCRSFARSLAAENMHAPFKFVTLTTDCTDESFVAPLAAVGMTGCGVGVETLSVDGRSLERKTRERNVVEAAAVAARCGVSLTAYVQVGLPGQRRADVFYTLRRLRELGYRLRPTGHTPFHRLAAMTVDDLDRLDLYAWDRKSFWSPESGLTRGELLTLVGDPESFSSIDLASHLEVA